jgi:hypothetical protein
VQAITASPGLVKLFTIWRIVAFDYTTEKPGRMQETASSAKTTFTNVAALTQPIAVNHLP